MFLLKANFKNQCEVELFIVFMWISSEFKPHRNSDMETLKCSHLHQNVANNAERLKKGFNQYVGKTKGFSRFKYYILKINI